MYIFVTSHNTKKHDPSSCRDLVHYYEKENALVAEEERELFFNSSQDDIQAREVIDGIDNNYRGKGLKNKDAKFYNVFINPSQDELRHITNDKNSLKEYARDIMKEYADTFNRNSRNGERVTIDDLVWYGKIETQRYFKKENKIVKHNEAYTKILKELRAETNTEKQDLLKEKLNQMGGLYVIQEDNTIVQRAGGALYTDTVIRRNMPRPEAYQNHIHIIVSRCHRTERRSFSPMANARNSRNTLNGQPVQIGFDRAEFARRGEVLFDCRFNYNRDFRRSYTFNGFGRDHYRRRRTQGLHSESMDYYSVLINGKLLDKQAREMNIGVSQLSVLLYRASEDRTGISKTLDRFVEQFHPGFVQQRFNQQYDAIKKLKFLDRFSVANIPADLLKKGVEAAVKPLTQSFVI